MTLGENMVLKERLRIIANIARIKNLEMEPILDNVIGDLGDALPTYQVSLRIFEKIKEILPKEDRVKIDKALTTIGIKAVGDYIKQQEEAAKNAAVRQLQRAQQDSTVNNSPAARKLRELVATSGEKPVTKLDEDPEIKSNKKFLDLRVPDEPPEIVTAESLKKGFAEDKNKKS